MGIQQMLLSGGGLDGYSIDNSLRFQSGDSEHLLWTPTSSGDRRTWTWSGWVKLCGHSGHLISSDNDDFQFEIRSDYQYLIKNAGCFSNTWSGTTYSENQFYHFVIEHDARNTYCKIWVDGSLSQTITATNDRGSFNANEVHGIGCRSTSLDSFSDFYLAEVHFVDGTALSASSFGETVDGSWVPKEYTHSDISSTDMFDVYGLVTNSAKAVQNIGSLSSLATNVRTFDLGSPAHNNITLDYGSVGTYTITATHYMANPSFPNVSKSDNGTSWTTISSGQDPFTFTGRYIQWARTSGSGYGNCAVIQPGLNDFHLKFDNASNKGEDSANSNDWSAHNFDGTSIGAYSRGC